VNHPKGSPIPGHASSRERLQGWPRTLFIFAILTLIYLINRREPISTSDTLAAELLPLPILRGEGPFLDRFSRFLAPAGTPMYLPIAWSRGHLVSRYPIAPALLSVPLEAPQVWYFDRSSPGWDRDIRLTWIICRRMAKNSSAVVAALVGAALHRLLRRLGLGRVALPTVLAAALGSDLWTVASQAPWQHGPAALALVVSLLLLLPERPMTRTRLLLAGLTTALLVLFRPLNLVLACVILAWVSWHHPRKLAWFLSGPALLGAGLIAYNAWFFGRIEGGQHELEQYHMALHGTAGVWSGDLLAGASGTLFSPSRGLFVYCPWVVIALAALPMVAGRLRPWSLVSWLLAALVPYLLVLSKYSVWWAGHSFGPRYWTDVIPLFAILLGFGLDEARARRRPLLVVFGMSIAVSLVIQTVGAFCYPSSWNLHPANVDLHHERLWDWSDNELTRCVLEGLKPR
jgi:hypothetical protein